MIGDSDFGWGDTEGEARHAFGGVGSATLVVASGLYCAAVWLATGLQPLPFLASRLSGLRGAFPQGVDQTR
jgi:hypothetical protein